MNKNTYTIVLLLAVLISSCKNEKKVPEQSTSEKTDLVKFIPFPGGNKTSLPNLFSNDEATVLSYVKVLNDSTTQFNYSYLVDGGWTKPSEIITGTDWFVNWADYPAITVNNGNLLSHILKKSSKETFSYDINLNILPKGDSDWRTNLPLHTDGTKTEHGFVTMLPFNDDSFFITWLDGRNMGKNNHEHGGHKGEMTIRAAKIGFDGTISNNVVIDEKACTCCQTTAAITANGPIVLYRDKTNEDIRDIAITRLVNNEWTDPKFIFDDGWEIKGCPVNGPKVVAIDNTIAVSWFTAAQDEPKVKVTFSENGGEDFTPPTLIASKDVLGRVDIALIDKDNAVVSWMENIEKVTYLKAMKVNKSGAKSEAITISKMDGSRKTGFPQMERVGDKLYFAWTSLENKSSSIKTAFIKLDLF